MATTILSGTSGALYYKPAGTTDTFAETDVNVGTDTITVKTYLNFKVGDPVQFSVVNTTVATTLQLEHFRFPQPMAVLP